MNKNALKIEKDLEGRPVLAEEQNKALDTTKESAEEKVAVSPEGWSGTTKAMKKHKEITNPYSLAWWLSKRKPGEKWGPGGKGKLTKKPEPHYEPEKKSEEEIVKKLPEQQIEQHVKMSFDEESIIKDVIKTIVN